MFPVSITIRFRAGGPARVCRATVFEMGVYIMSCTGVDHATTELDFVASLYARDGCCGPLLTLSFSGYRLELLEESLGAEDVLDRLWDGFDPHYPGPVTFQLCAAHWMDLSYAWGVRAQQHHRLDWFNEASALLLQLSTAAGWDAKEISNLLTWQRVQLT